MKYGASDFIEKPWSNDSLVEKVQSLTRRVHATRSSQRISNYEREDAQQLQTRIVPRRHITTGGIELFGDSLPAGVVGGDYFGVWQPVPDALHFCIADVSGKGTPGALIAAMLYASVTTLSSSSNSAETIIHNVELILRDQLGEGHYVTIVYGVLDLKTHALEYVNAGHCPPILRRANGTMESLSPTRPVLGFMFDGGRSERLALLPADRLVLYTDGITEPADASGDEFGADRLSEIVAQNPGQPLEEQYHTIMQRVRQHAEGKFSDDATLVLVTVHEKPQ
jgi:sigma-B regulation protein RsbU (phosphoserine phosphatase)